jgi:2-dehydro-3-deoxyphosphogluconate aldolase/(4S)-4-hydroxy-2-oxoglutarate aldolase
MPTGGVEATREDIERWIKAGACCLGMGSKLITNSALVANDYVLIRKNVKNVLDWIEEARK